MAVIVLMSARATPASLNAITQPLHTSVLVPYAVATRLKDMGFGGNKIAELTTSRSATACPSS